MQRHSLIRILQICFSIVICDLFIFYLQMTGYTYKLLENW